MKPLQGPCDHCGSIIQYPAERVGLRAPCPRCGQETELRLATPPNEPSVPRRVIVWTVVAILVMVLGLVAALIALKQAQGWSERHRAPATHRALQR